VQNSGFLERSTIAAHAESLVLASNSVAIRSF
jgi:hypothetical protein